MIKKNDHPQVFFISVFILYFFKYPIDGFFGTGIRIEDVLIFPTFFYFILTNKRKLFISSFLKPFKSFIIWCILVAFYNSFMIDNGLSFLKSIIFTARHIEYLMLFYIGTMLNWNHWVSALKLFVIYQLILVFSQKLGLISFGTLFNVVERQVGSTAGPWELAVMICMPLFLFLKMKKYPYAIACFFILYSTQSRITIVAVFVILMLSLIKNLMVNNNVINKIILFFLLSLIIAVPFSISLQDSNLIQRISSVTQIQAENFTYIQTKTISANEFKQYDKYYIKTNVNTAQGDASAFSRFSRWNLAVKTVNSYGGHAFIFGMGPSFFGNALDGAYLRLFVTTGVVGLALFLLFYIKTSAHLKSSIFLMQFFIAYLISALFIDVFYSIKINIIFWLTFGSYFLHEKNTSNNKI